MPDYSLIKCPTILNDWFGYSRVVVVYVHESVVFKVRNDLMSNEYSAIWIQIGLPGRKRILVCHTYREWQELCEENRGMSSNWMSDQL